MNTKERIAQQGAALPDLPAEVLTGIVRRTDDAARRALPVVCKALQLTLCVCCGRALFFMALRVKTLFSRMFGKRRPWYTDRTNYRLIAHMKAETNAHLSV